MATRIVDVEGFELVTAHNAAGSARWSASVSAVGVREQTCVAASSVASSLSAAVVAGRAASVSHVTSAAFTVAASVASPVDLSSSLLAGSGSTGAGSLTITDYDQAFKVTVSNANISGYHVSTAPTPGIEVRMPTPSTPNASHWMTVVWTISGTKRRVFHNPRINWLINGEVIEPLSTAGSVATLAYTWDVAAQGWYVSSSSGNVLTRTHSPDESPTDLPLYFTPECRALGSFSTIKTVHQDALATMPASVSTHLGSLGQFVDITSDSGTAYTDGAMSGYMFESLINRNVFNGAYGSGVSGVYSDPSVQAYPTTTSTPARTMVHELGHAWDTHCMSFIDATWGVDPVPPASALDVDSVYIYWPDGVTLKSETHYNGADFYWVDYNESGVAYWGGVGQRTPYPAFRTEAPIVDLYATVADKPGQYYRATITEWVAQCFMLVWAEQLGWDSTTVNTLTTAIGGSTLANGQAILADFRDYAVSIGVVPSDW